MKGSDMETCKNSGTVRGLGIATLILTILCLICCLCAFPLAGKVADYLSTHQDTISDEVKNAMLNSSADAQAAVTSVTVNGTAVDIEAIEAAFASSSNTEISKFATFLKDVTKGDIAGMYDFLTNTSEADLIAMRDSVANLTDDELNAMVASTSGVTLAQMQAFRTSAQEITDKEISDISVFVGPEGMTNLVDALCLSTAGIMIGLAIFLIIFNAIVLIGCILAIKNSKNPDKLTAAFVLAIIGAVICFFEFAWVRCILEIVLAVQISKVRNWGKYQSAKNNQFAQPGAVEQDIPNILQ